MELLKAISLETTSLFCTLQGNFLIFWPLYVDEFSQSESSHAASTHIQTSELQPFHWGNSPLVCLPPVILTPEAAIILASVTADQAPDLLKWASPLFLLEAGFLCSSSLCFHVVWLVEFLERGSNHLFHKKGYKQGNTCKNMLSNSMFKKKKAETTI